MNAPARAAPRRLAGAALLALLILVAWRTAPPRPQDAMPVEFQGEWVTATRTCDSPVRFRVSATRMSLINGRDTASWGDIAIAHSFFGPDYDGIQVVAMPEFNSGNPPFTVTFNADERRGATRLDIYHETANPTRNPAVEAIQSAARALASRFPMNEVSLRKCSGVLPGGDP